MRNKENIAEALRQYRLRRGWTFRELARAAKVPVSTIHPIVLGLQKPTELTIYAIETNIPDLWDKYKAA